MNSPSLEFDYAAEIDRCRTWIEASLERSTFQGVATHRFEDVKEMLLAGQAELWSTERGCVVTFISQFPLGNLMTAWLAGGDFEHVMDQWEESIYQWGRDNGCKIIYVMGRRGWKRKLKARDYVEHATVVSKLL